MRIKSVDITNGLQHKKLKADFTNFNVIIGPNGCGKSSVVELIGYGLTNKFTWPGTLDTMVTQGEEKGSVELVIESEGEDVFIKTALGRTSRKLTRGDTKISKSGEVIEYVQDVLLRTPFELVNEASIVRQGQLGAGLFTTQAKRQQIFQRLAGLMDVEAKRKQLSDEKSVYTPFMVSFDLDEKKRRAEELTARAAKLEAERADFASIEISQARYDQCKVLLANLENMKKYSAEQSELSIQQRRVAPLLATAQSQLNTATSSAGDLSSRVAASRADYDSALVTVATEAAVKKRADEYLRLTNILATTNLQLTELSEVPDSFVDEAKLAEFATIHADALSQITQAKRIVDHLSAADKKCPTCGTELDDPTAIIASGNATITEMADIAGMAESEIQSMTVGKGEWVRKLAAYRDQLLSLQATVASTQASLTAMGPEGPASAGNTVVDEARELINTFTALLSAERDAQSALTSIRDTYNALSTEAQVCDTKLASVNNNLAGVGTTDGSASTVQEATSYVTAADEHATALSTLTGQITEVGRQLQEALQGLKDTEAKVEDAKKYKVLADHIEFARSALHRDNFPSGKIKGFIDRVLINAESYLDEMQAGFTISYDNETGFIAYFPEKGTTMRADRLSGGEQVTFSLAFRFAVNEVKSETGFLMLDEPTAHLDDEHVDNVVKVLELVKKKLAGRVQLFIVTHNEKMAAVADTVLEVNKASA